MDQYRAYIFVGGTDEHARCKVSFVGPSKIHVVGD